MSKSTLEASISKMNNGYEHSLEGLKPSPRTSQGNV